MKTGVVFAYVCDNGKAHAACGGCGKWLAARDPSEPLQSFLDDLHEHGTPCPERVGK